MAGPPGGDPPRPVSDEQRAVDELAGLIARSHAVLAIHDRGCTPFFEIVLWVEDGANPGRLDPHELLVISHSEVLWTVCGYSSGPPEDARKGAARSDELDLSELRDARFCARWRDRQNVNPSILATGVTALQLTPLGPAEGGGHLVRIALTFTSDSTDGPEEVHSVVNVALCTHRAEE